MIREHESFLRAVHVLLDAALLAVTFWAVHQLQDGLRAWLGLARS